MPLHARAQIQAALVTAVTGLAATGSNVEAAPVFAVGEERLPGLFVWAGNEAIEPSALGGRQARTLDLIVLGAGRAATAVALDAMLEAMAAEIEAAVLTDSPLLALIDQLELISIAKQNDETADQSAGAIRITFEAEYRTQEGAPTALLG